MSGSFNDAALTLLLNTLPLLLRVYWVLASVAVLVTILPLPIPGAFKAAVRLAAARGKLWHDRPDARSLGILKDTSVPQQFFVHFYLIGALVNTLILHLYIFVCCEEQDGGTIKRDALIALLLFELHVLRRYFETTYVMHYPDSARMHLLAYLYGLTYYIAVPLTLLPSTVLNLGVIRSGWNVALGAGKEHWRSIDQRVWEAVAAPHPGLARLLAGLVLFLFASILQYWSHAVLGRLSREADKRAQEAKIAATLFKQQCAGAATPAPGPKLTDVYNVPRGGLFEMVSCPHYLAEILIYVALAIVTRGSVGSILIVAWVLVNLVLAADATQRWYHRCFPEYPRTRAALIPLLF
ncbi:hypothetical protein Vafri_8361 [Volvox africanus]|nr:hypothetical protein Vafri_8361 [Volvox africanus]